MKFEYPTKKGNNYNPARRSTGLYPLSQLNTWHGGIHVEGDEIYAIADGEVVHRRFDKDYKKITVDGKDYFVSGNYVLLKHTYRIPTGKKKGFFSKDVIEYNFFSLYHHLRPVNEMKKDGKVSIFSDNESIKEIKAGEVIGYTGRCDVLGLDSRENKKYCHVEVFSKDDPDDFFKDMKELVKDDNKIYEKEEISDKFCSVITGGDNKICENNFTRVKHYYAEDDLSGLKDNELMYGTKVSKEFVGKVIQICKRLWPKNTIRMANYLMAIMAWETGTTFDPAIVNRAKKPSGATGLIQFMASTFEYLLSLPKKSVSYNEIKLSDGRIVPYIKEVAELTAIQQLDLVEKHFRPMKNRTDIRFIDLYLQVLFPASARIKEDHVVFANDKSKIPDEVGHKDLRFNSYVGNMGMDLNKDGVIMKSEIEEKIRKDHLEVGKKFKIKLTSEYERIIDDYEKKNGNRKWMKTFTETFTQKFNNSIKYNKQ